MNFKRLEHPKDNVCDLFAHCLTQANGYDHSFESTVAQISKETGISPKIVRNSLDILKRTNEISIESGNRFSTIIIINYYQYLLDDDLGKQDISVQNIGQTDEQTPFEEIPELEPDPGLEPVIEQGQTNNQNPIYKYSQTIPIYAAETVMLNHTIEIKGKCDIDQLGQCLIQDNESCFSINRIRVVPGFRTIVDSDDLKIIIENLWQNEPFRIHEGAIIADLVVFYD